MFEDIRQKYLNQNSTVDPTVMPSTSGGGQFEDIRQKYLGETKTVTKKPTTFTDVTKNALNIVDYLLQGPEYAYSGMLEKGFKEAKTIKARKEKGESVSELERFFKVWGLSPYNIPGIPQGLQQRKTLPQVIEEQTESKPLAYGIGLTGSFAIPSVPLAKVVKPIKSFIPEVPKALESVATGLKSAFVYRGGQPAQYAEKAEEAIAESLRGLEKGKELAQQLIKGLTKEEQLKAGQILRGELPLNQAGEKLQKLIEPARAELQKLGGGIIEEARLGGIAITEQTINTIQKNMETYMPRLYRTYEKNPEGFVKWLGTGKSRMILDRLRKRVDIPIEVREAMGEILEPGYPVGKAVAQLSDTVAKSKLFRWVNENFAQTANITGDLVQLPAVKTLGILSEKWVPKSIGEDLTPMIIKKIPKLPEQLYLKALGLWKSGKILLNPATRARNQISNMMLMNIVGGMDPINVANPARWIDAMSELVKKGTFYKALKSDTTLLSSTFYGNEIAPYLDNFAQEGGNAILRTMKAIGKGLGGSYQAQEEIGKMVLTKYWVERGKTLKEAAKIAEDSLFNYRKVPPAIKWLREVPFGYPFISFSYFAIPKVTRELVKRPERLAPYARTGKAIEQYAEGEFGEKGELDEFMKKGQYLRLPFQKNGQDLYLDLNYLLPWGNLLEMTGRLYEPQNPAYTLIADLYRNKSSYTQKEVWKETDTNEEKLKKAGDYIYKVLMPPFAPGGLDVDSLTRGGYSWQKLVDAFKQRPDYFGRVRDIPTTLIDTILGLKATPVDYSQVQQGKLIERRKTIQDLRDQIRSTSLDKRLFPEEKQERLKKLNEKLQKVIQRIE